MEKILISTVLIFVFFIDSILHAAVVPQLKAGQNHSLALKSDGTIYTWGYNYHYELGNGTNDNNSTPEKVDNLDDMIAVGAGYYHSMAVKSDGTVWSWGSNGWMGRLGDGTTEDRSTPVKTLILEDIIALAAGWGHSLALKSDGTVWSWGHNGTGQLGNGTLENNSTPTQIEGISDIIAIACGSYFSMALKSDGTVWAWGDNGGGQLGDGTEDYKKSPQQVIDVTNIKAIACGSTRSLALQADGTVWAWGIYNASNQYPKTYPEKINGLNNVTAIGSGEYHDVFLKTDGTVWTRGFNGYYVLGVDDNTYKSPNYLYQVSNLGTIVAIAVGMHHNLALKHDGTVWGWGNNEYGQLGNDNLKTTNLVVQTNIYIEDTEEYFPIPTPSQSPTPTLLPSPTVFPTLTTPLSTATPSQTPVPGGNGTVYGFVYNADEESLRNVTVAITGNNFSDSTTTDEDGYYEFSSLKEGDYTITFEKEGYQSYTEDISHTEGETLDMGTIIMETIEKGMIYGYVTNIKGNPVEYVRLKLKGISTKTKKQTSSDADGYFEFKDLEADTYIITAKKSGFKPVNQRIKLGDGEVTDIEIVMKKSSRRIVFVED